MRTFFFIFLSCCLSLSAYADEWQPQREQFADDLRAAEAGQFHDWDDAERRDYPLYPYLRYADLKRRLSTANSEEVEAFLTLYADTPLAQLIHERWLSLLARNKRWIDYAKFAQDTHASGSTKRQCEWLIAQQVLNKGIDRQWLAEAEPLWMVGHSQDDACDPVFDVLEQFAWINNQRRWERSLLALEEGNYSLASFIAKPLAKKQRDQLASIIRLLRNPKVNIQDKQFRQDNVWNRRWMVQAMQQLSNQDWPTAYALWQELKPLYAFEKKQINQVEQELGLRAAYRHYPEALSLLSSLPSEAHDDNSRQWRLRTALRQSDWKEALNSLHDMPVGMRNQPEQRYWLARATSEIGNRNTAELLFGKLAQETSYYGFLAADKLSADYATDGIVVKRNEAAQQTVAAMPSVQRAKELILLDRKVDARREWAYALSNMSDEQAQQAARLARKWGWNFAVILALSKSKTWDAVDLRFPTPYKEQVIKAAQQQRVDPEWIYGVIRRESSYMQDARSSAGALGLMQLMPATARQVGRRIGLGKVRQWDILEPENNIQLGAAYLSQMYQRFDGHQVLATAAYNAGPHRVDKWLPEEAPMAADQWVESIPFKETREYVRAVMAYTTIFDNRLDHRSGLLAQRMKSIPSSASEDE